MTALKMKQGQCVQKEAANDYRYFPEPDLLPVVISDEELEEIKVHLPELPEEKENRFIEEHQLRESEAKILASRKLWQICLKRHVTKTR